MLGFRRQGVIAFEEPPRNQEAPDKLLVRPSDLCFEGTGAH